MTYVLLGFPIRRTMSLVLAHTKKNSEIIKSFVYERVAGDDNLTPNPPPPSKTNIFTHNFLIDNASQRIAIDFRGPIPVGLV